VGERARARGRLRPDPHPYLLRMREKGILLVSFDDIAKHASSGREEF